MKIITTIMILFFVGLTIVTAQQPIIVTTGTSDNGLAAHFFSWTDANNLPRTAVMVDQRAGGAGYLRKFTYQVNGSDRICRGTGANGHEGDGYLQNHTAYGGDRSSHTVAGTTSIPLNGKNHAIIDFYMTSYVIDSPPGSANSTTVVPSRVQWFFATGRNYPIFSVTQDARGTAGNLGADSRSPYGDFHYDGTTDYSSPYSGDQIGGASWGDTHKWVSVTNGTTDESSQVTTNSGWRYDESNSIPYAMQWTKNVNAEMGHVLTQPISVNDMGLNPSPALTNTQNLNGPMISDGQWVYQILNYGIIDATGGVTKRLTWGTNWGHPGGFDEYGAYPSSTDYTRHSDGTRVNGMLLGYSVFVVLGEHTGAYKGGAVGKMVQQMENMQKATFTASVGTVRTSGPAGPGLANNANNNVTYVPAGYNHIYATWEADAASNMVDLTLTPGLNAAIENPIFVINNFIASSISFVQIGGSFAKADVDYFASTDPANTRVWITLNRTITNPVEVFVSGVPSDVNDIQQNKISIFPNPTSGIINIQNFGIDAGTIEISDELGCIVKQQNFSTGQNIDISDQPDGLYFVKIISDSKIRIKRIIKLSK